MEAELPIISANPKYPHPSVDNRTASSPNPVAGPKESPGVGYLSIVQIDLASPRWMARWARFRTFADTVGRS